MGMVGLHERVARAGAQNLAIGPEHGRQCADYGGHRVGRGH